MLLRISESEIGALKLLCGSGFYVRDLAGKLAVKPSFVSKLLRSLEAKGLVTYDKQGTSKLVKLSAASHAQLFKRLYESRPDARIETWLSGRALDVLAVLAGREVGASMELLSKECSSSKPVIYAALKSLRGAGVVSSSSKGTYLVTDHLVYEFANAFADNLQLLLQKEIPGKGYAVSVRVRKHVIVRTEAQQAPEFCTRTGVNALGESGLNVMRTSYYDYYFNLDKVRRELSPEEGFIHALLLTTLQQHQDVPALGLFLKVNLDRNYINSPHAKPLKLQKLSELAKVYYVEKEMSELRSSVEFYEKMRSFE